VYSDHHSPTSTCGRLVFDDSHYPASGQQRYIYSRREGIPGDIKLVCIPLVSIVFPNLVFVTYIVAYFRGTLLGNHRHHGVFHFQAAGSLSQIPRRARTIGEVSLVALMAMLTNTGRATDMHSRVSRTARERNEQKDRDRAQRAREDHRHEDHQREDHRRKHSSGNAELPVMPEQATPREENENSQHKQEGNKKKPKGKNQRTQRGGVKNRKRKENQKKSEREAAMKREKTISERQEMTLKPDQAASQGEKATAVPEKSLLHLIPDQRGSIQGQRAVDRRSVIDRPWRKLDFTQGNTRGGNTGASGIEQHKGGHEHPSRNLSAQNIPHKPVTGNETNGQNTKKIPTEPKSDRLARERREAAAARASAAEVLKVSSKSRGDPFLRTPQGRLPDYKFGRDDWSLHEPSTESDVGDRKSRAVDHEGAGPEKQETSTSDQPQHEETSASTENRNSTTAIDWASIKEWMESKLGKPTTGQPRARSDEPPASAEAAEPAKVEQTDIKHDTSQGNSPVWSFDKVI